MKLLEKVGGPLLGVADANRNAINPTAQPTATPANISFILILLIVIFLSGG
jgi:hypothetical protein